MVEKKKVNGRKEEWEVLKAVRYEHGVDQFIEVSLKRPPKKKRGKETFPFISISRGISVQEGDDPHPTRYYQKQFTVPRALARWVSEQLIVMLENGNGKEENEE